MTAPVRWGILGTANIAARAFLPALREAGGQAVAVGSRSPDSGRDWAQRHGVQRAEDYAGVIAASDIDAIYVALPNDQHVEWTAAAAATGKAVLCEKPAALRPEQLVELAHPDVPVWEAFVFPFHPQTTLLNQLIDGGELGALAQLNSEFHFQLTRPDNIRWRPELGGGALFDVGCYPIRLARLLFGTEPTSATAAASWTAAGVDAEVAAILDFPSDGRLVMSAGLRRSLSTFTRIVGSTAELRVSNPFHPTGADTVELWRDGARVQRWSPGPGTAFEHALGHIHSVVRGESPARHTVREDGYAQCAALNLTRDAMGTPIDAAER